jgi:hypothetical protein
MAIEPIAVKAHDNSDTAPSCAMLVGSMMMPDPIMLTVTSVVSPIRLIFLLESVIANSLSRLAGWLRMFWLGKAAHLARPWPEA